MWTSLNLDLDLDLDMKLNLSLDMFEPGSVTGNESESESTCL